MIPVNSETDSDGTSANTNQANCKLPIEEDHLLEEDPLEDLPGACIACLRDWRAAGLIEAACCMEQYALSAPSRRGSHSDVALALSLFDARRRFSLGSHLCSYSLMHAPRATGLPCHSYLTFLCLSVTENRFHLDRAFFHLLGLFFTAVSIGLRRSPEY